MTEIQTHPYGPSSLVATYPYGTYGYSTYPYGTYAGSNTGIVVTPNWTVGSPPPATDADAAPTESPLEWLDRRVDEIVSLVGAA